MTVRKTRLAIRTVIGRSHVVTIESVSAIIARARVVFIAGTAPRLAVDVVCVASVKHRVASVARNGVVVAAARTPLLLGSTAAADDPYVRHLGDRSQFFASFARRRLVIDA